MRRQNIACRTLCAYSFVAPLQRGSLPFRDVQWISSQYVIAHHRFKSEFEMKGEVMTVTGNSKNGNAHGNSNRPSDYRDLALSSGSEGLFLVDCNNQVVFCNPQLEQLINLDSNSLIGQGHLALFQHIAERCLDATKTTRELAAALEKVEQKPIVSLAICQPNPVRLQVQLFPFRDDQKTYRR